jgi:hypothetical protein
MKMFPELRVHQNWLEVDLKNSKRASSKKSDVRAKFKILPSMLKDVDSKWGRRRRMLKKSL